MYKNILTATTSTQGFAAALISVNSEGFAGLLTSFPKFIGLLGLYATGTMEATIGTSSFKAAMDALNINPVILALSVLIAVVAGGIAIFNAVTTSTEEWEQTLSDSKSALSQAQQETKSLNEQLETTQQRIDELNNKKKLTLTEEGELDRLKQQNAELRKKIELSQLAEEQANKDVRKKFVNTMESDFGNDREYSLRDLPQTESITKEIIRREQNAKDMTEQSLADLTGEQEYIKYAFIAVDELKAKLYKASTQKEKQEIETQISEVEKFLQDEYKKFGTRAEGTARVANPKTDEDKRSNELLDYIDDFNNKLLISTGDTSSIKTVWDNLWTSDKYKSATTELEKLSKSGELTADSLKKLVQTNSDVKVFIDKLKELGLIKTDNLETVANQINGVKEAAKNDSSKTIEAKSFSDIYDEVKDKAKLVAQAEKEMSENGVISTDTMASLIKQGLATENQFTKTAKGFTLSKNALQNLNKTAQQAYQNDLNNAKKAANTVIEAETGKTLAISATTEEYIKQLDVLKASAYSNAYQKEIERLGGGHDAWAINSAVDAGRKASSELGSQINSLKKSLKNADYIKKTANKIFDGIGNDTLNSSGSSSKETAGSKALKLWEAKKKTWKHELEMGDISEDTYHKRLNANYRKYLKNYSETLDERRSMEEDWYKWQITKAQNTWSKLNGEKKHALEMGQISETQYRKWVIGSYQNILGNYKETLEQRRQIEEEYYQWANEQETKRLNLVKTKLDGAKSAVDDVLDDEIENLNTQKDLVEKAYQKEIDNIQSEIDSLKEKNEEKEREIDLEEKALALAKARNNRSIMQYTKDGMRYVADKSEIKSAQKSYDDAKLEKQTNELQKQIDLLEESKENATKAIDSQIEVYNEYKDMWQKAVEAQEKAQNKMYANTQLWANWEKAVLQGNIDLLNTFIKKYNQASKMIDLDSVKNNNSDLTKGEVNKKYTLISPVIDLSKFNSALADFNSSVKTIMNGGLKALSEGIGGLSNITTKNTSNVFNGGITINKPVGNVEDLARSLQEQLPLIMNQYK